MSKLNHRPDIEMDEHDTDSPSRGEPVFLVIGKFRHSHGIKGEIAMEVYTDFPERLHPKGMVYVGISHQALTIKTIRWKNKLMLLSFEGYPDLEEVNVFRNELVYTISNRLPSLPDGQYYHHQLLGMSVLDTSGILLGTLQEILQTGANDVYVVRPETGPEILLPAIDSVIEQVDLEKQVIIVNPPEWS
jgi:16S rRNA processing protein RimM